MENFTKTHQLDLEMTFRNANVYMVMEEKAAIVQASGAYITINEFKEIFNFLTDMIISNGIGKLIFDKRELMVFHQPSMEWYFVVWKEKMFDHGLKTHRKILPKDPVFRQSVKIGRENINKAYPHGKFHQMDIKYFESIDDAIAN